jgi:hypothetical protein
MSAALGTVAVERIVDGLTISLLFFGSYLTSSGHVFSRELRIGAWLSLGGFVGLTTFLALALVRTEATIRVFLRLSLRRLAPARADSRRGQLERVCVRRRAARTSDRLVRGGRLDRSHDPVQRTQRLAARRGPRLEPRGRASGGGAGHVSDA